MEHDLTRGNVLKTIAVFALPYMLSYFLQMLYGMADLYMMGQLAVPPASPPWVMARRRSTSLP